MGTLFEFADYKRYLRARFDGPGSTRTGSRTAFARAVNCQPAYLSRVLNGDAHLSPEQAERASVFLGHSSEEERYFFFLVLLNRAGTSNLRTKLSAALKDVKERQLQLKNRVPLRQPLAQDAQVTYYSAWYYTAVHMLLDIQAPWTAERIAAALELSTRRVGEVLAFLERHGLVEHTNGRYRIRERETHLDADSPLVSQHHVNWRMKAIQSLEKRSDGLHYSSIVTTSKENLPRIREVMVSAIAEIRKIVRATDKEEVLYSYCLDLFPVGAPESR